MLLPVLLLLVLFSARSFALMHDCGHESLFKTRWLNRPVGFLLGCLNAIPQHPWSRGHAFHHKHNGNWDRYRGPSALLTLSDYLALSPRQRWFYGLSRHPLMLFPGGCYYLLIRPRLELVLGVAEWLAAMASHLGQKGLAGLAELPELSSNFRSSHWYTSAECIDLFANNLVVLTSWWLMGSWLGHGLFWSCYLFVMTLSAALFLCIFFVQHNFADSYASGSEGWDYQRGALKGSSNLEMPAILNWFWADISFHSIHHLCERIPNYRLQACHEANSALLAECPRLSLKDFPSSFRYVLWNSDAKKLLTLAEANVSAINS
ncbi:fatty acid desaturase [Cyanobium sp. T1G-Tous]|uniref:fatty acid desaturase n=1 Tax=Cyanobium sp. T1G-Tous TaxID=2823722 RepID=UPI0020CCF7BB|nr:fatty acid desaturase [Cyanobium sp. T1G-Tous]